MIVLFLSRLSNIPRMNKAIKNIKIAIADDHQLFGEMIESWVKLDKEWKGIEVIFKAYDGLELIEQLKRHKPDIILMDLKMPKCDGMEATALIKAEYPDIKILILSMYDEKKFIIELIEKGANGYLLKNISSEELIQAIRTVAESDYYYNENLSEAMVKGWLNKKRIKPNLDDIVNLTAREKEVLELICGGHITVEIASILDIGSRTVEGHRSELLSKTGARNTASLVKYAVENDLVPLDLKNRQNA